MGPLSEPERRRIEQQLAALRAEYNAVKAELRYLLKLARQWQRELLEKEARHGARWN